MIPGIWIHTVKDIFQFFNCSEEMHCSFWKDHMWNWSSVCKKRIYHWFDEFEKKCLYNVTPQTVMMEFHPALLSEGWLWIHSVVLGTWIPVQLIHGELPARLNAQLLAVVVAIPDQELSSRGDDFRCTVVHLAFVLEGCQVLLLRTTSAVHISHPVGLGFMLGIDEVTLDAVLVYLWHKVAVDRTIQYIDRGSLLLTWTNFNPSTDK